jgi:hypothetical protein
MGEAALPPSPPLLPGVFVDGDQSVDLGNHHRAALPGREEAAGRGGRPRGPRAPRRRHQPGRRCRARGHRVLRPGRAASVPSRQEATPAARGGDEDHPEAAPAHGSGVPGRAAARVRRRLGL